MVTWLYASTSGCLFMGLGNMQLEMFRMTSIQFTWIVHQNANLVTQETIQNFVFGVDFFNCADTVTYNMNSI
jgi:hypothetical protein